MHSGVFACYDNHQSHLSVEHLKCTCYNLEELNCLF